MTDICIKSSCTAMFRLETIKGNFEMHYPLVLMCHMQQSCDRMW